MLSHERQSAQMSEMTAHPVWHRMLYSCTYSVSQKNPRCWPLAFWHFFTNSWEFL